MTKQDVFQYKVGNGYILQERGFPNNPSGMMGWCQEPGTWEVTGTLNPKFGDPFDKFGVFHKIYIHSSMVVTDKFGDVTS